MDQISKDDATLLNAEGAFEFLVEELSKLNTGLGLDLLYHVKQEISKRRNKPIVDLLKYLHNPQSLEEKSEPFFAMSSKKEKQKQLLMFGKLISTVMKQHQRSLTHNQQINIYSTFRLMYVLGWQLRSARFKKRKVKLYRMTLLNPLKEQSIATL